MTNLSGNHLNQDSEHMQNLKDYLSKTSPGPILDKTYLERFLELCWGEFEGSYQESMAGFKLIGRMEDVTWEPPVLQFLIERHGGTALGSSRADLHAWYVNIDEKKASCDDAGYRQVWSRQPVLKVKPIAEEIDKLILDGKEDERLKWKDGIVTIRIGKIIPEKGTNQKTLIGRRKRFRIAIENILFNAGWVRVRANVYKPLDTQSSSK